MPRQTTEGMLAVTLLPGQRPEPPEKLTECQKEIWRSIVAAKPSNWFSPDNYPLLVALCRHIEYADRVAQQVDGYPMLLLSDEDGLIQYDRLMGVLRKADTQIGSLMTKMRLTQQSKIEAAAAGGHGATSMPNSEGSERKPWQRMMVS